MPTYILPVAPSLAVLVALMLERRLREPSPHMQAAHAPDGREDAEPTLRTASSRYRPPDVVYTLFVCTVITAAAITAGAALTGVVAWPFTLVFWVVPVGATALMVLWRRDAGSRVRGMAIVFAAWCAAVTWGIVQEDRVRAVTDPRAILATIEQAVGQPDPAITVVGRNDPTLAFYADLKVHYERELPPPRSAGELFLIDTSVWKELKQDPEVAGAFAERIEVTWWYDRELVLLETVRVPSQPASPEPARAAADLDPRAAGPSA